MSTTKIPSASRRYDIDWIRVIAIGLLLVYHVAIGFQPWGIMIQFVTNEQSWSSLWSFMAVFNIWRIPLLFFVSGMGVYFALEHRNLKQLIIERTSRILIPYIFGAIAVFPVSTYIWQRYYNFDATYNPHPGHLWFLGNIFMYVLLLGPLLLYLKRNEKAIRIIRYLFGSPLSLLFVMGAFLAEVLLIKPMIYEMYADTWHGFALGLIAFLSGFLMVVSGNAFWNMLQKWRWPLLSLAIALFLVRLLWFELLAPNYLKVIESQCWIFVVFAFGSRHLNRPSKTLSYLGQAAYPVYILHLIFLFLGSYLIFPLSLQPWIKFTLVLMFTLAGCLIGYEFVVKRWNLTRFLFGLRVRKVSKITEESVGSTA